MSIPDTFHFDKEGKVVKNLAFKRYFLSLTIVLVALLSFGVGRLSVSERAGVTINYDEKALNEVPIVKNPTNTAAAINSVPKSGEVVASSNGKRYYYSHCNNTISEKNKITFSSATMAESAGYTLALNCKAP